MEKIKLINEIKSIIEGWLKENNNGIDEELTYDSVIRIDGIDYSVYALVDVEIDEYYGTCLEEPCTYYEFTYYKLDVSYYDDDNNFFQVWPE